MGCSEDYRSLGGRFYNTVKALLLAILLKEKGEKTQIGHGEREEEVREKGLGAR